MGNQFVLYRPHKVVIFKELFENLFFRAFRVGKIAHMDGNGEAEEVFQDYGSVLGQAIRPFVLSFQPDVLLLGGGISQAVSFFEGALQEELPLDHLPPVICSKNLSRSALLGAAGHWLDQFAI